jgi:hypothetical protein
VLRGFRCLDERLPCDCRPPGTTRTSPFSPDRAEAMDVAWGRAIRARRRRIVGDPGHCDASLLLGGNAPGAGRAVMGNQSRQRHPRCRGGAISPLTSISPSPFSCPLCIYPIGFSSSDRGMPILRGLPRSISRTMRDDPPCRREQFAPISNETVGPAPRESSACYPRMSMSRRSTPQVPRILCNTSARRATRLFFLLIAFPDKASRGAVLIDPRCKRAISHSPPDWGRRSEGGLGILGAAASEGCFSSLRRSMTSHTGGGRCRADLGHQEVRKSHELRWTGNVGGWRHCRIPLTAVAPAPMPRRAAMQILMGEGDNRRGNGLIAGSSASPTRSPQGSPSP